MPVLQNPLHERACQAYVVLGLPQHEAYLKAGFKTKQIGKSLRTTASRFFNRPEVKERIAQLQFETVKRVGVTIDHLLMELDDAYKMAMRLKHPAAAVGAVTTKAKLLGLMVDKSEVDAVIRKPSRTPTGDKEMLLSDWKAKFAPKTQPEPKVPEPPKGTLQ